MKRAGAIIIGKTNTRIRPRPQTYNPVFGTTYNAYDQTKPPVKQRRRDLCLGATHAGGRRQLIRGSLRNPAAYNNVFGFRPLMGACRPKATMCSTRLRRTGPMARNVRTLRSCPVQAGYDPRVPLSNRQTQRNRAGPQTRFRGVRIAWLGNFDGLPFEAGVLDLCKAALKTFVGLGCIVEEAKPDHPIAASLAPWVKTAPGRLALHSRNSTAIPPSAR
jgi:amidase